MAYKAPDIAQNQNYNETHLPEGSVPVLVSGPKLRRIIGISPVTLWRWRHDERASFPVAKSINGRLYFSWPEVQAWIAKQQAAT